MDDVDKILIANLHALGSSGPFQSWTNYLDELEEDKILIAKVDVKNYNPHEISLRVQDGKIKVHGKHHSEGEFGYDSREFRRKFDLPEGVDPSTVSSRVSPGGVLYIEGYKTPPKDESEMAGDLDEKRFSVKLDVSKFAPEDISVKVLNNELMISASHESASQDHYTSRSFKRHFVLPRDVDMDSVVSKLDKDGRLCIEAPRKALPEPAERQLPITMD